MCSSSPPCYSEYTILVDNLMFLDINDTNVLEGFHLQSARRGRLYLTLSGQNSPMSTIQGIVQTQIGTEAPPAVREALHKLYLHAESVLSSLWREFSGDAQNPPNILLSRVGYFCFIIHLS